MTAYTESVQYQARWVSALWGRRGHWLPSLIKNICIIKTCWQRDNQFSLMEYFNTLQDTLQTPGVVRQHKKIQWYWKNFFFGLALAYMYGMAINKNKSHAWIWKITNRKLLESLERGKRKRRWYNYIIISESTGVIQKNKTWKNP